MSIRHDEENDKVKTSQENLKLQQNYHLLNLLNSHDYHVSKLTGQAALTHETLHTVTGDIKDQFCRMCIDTLPLVELRCLQKLFNNDFFWSYLYVQNNKESIEEACKLQAG